MITMLVQDFGKKWILKVIILNQEDIIKHVYMDGNGC
jgi:isoprenylcysteine carboxyl methyltransferase (ICMT) family protein YpbQ